MRRWLNRFASFFLIALVPSVVGWGLLVHWNAAGPGRFVRVWSWVADKLVVPLVLAPATDPAKTWLTDGTGPRVAAGFAILIIIWCLMLALPLSLILAWADWLGRRLTGSTSSGSSSIYDLPTLGSGSTSSWNGAYVITLPLALAWHGLKTMLPVGLIAAIPIAIVRFSYTYYTIFKHGRAGFTRRVDLLDKEWRTWFAWAGFHLPFSSWWTAQYAPTRQLARAMAKHPALYVDFYNHPEHYPYLIKALALEAVMVGLIIGMAVGLVVAVARAWKA